MPNVPIDVDLKRIWWTLGFARKLAAKNVHAKNGITPDTIVWTLQDPDAVKATLLCPDAGVTFVPASFNFTGRPLTLSLTVQSNAPLGRHPYTILAEIGNGEYWLAEADSPPEVIIP